MTMFNSTKVAAKSKTFGGCFLLFFGFYPLNVPGVCR